MSIVISGLCDNSHSNRCEVISHCGFDCISLIEMLNNFFLLPVGYLYDFLEKCLFRSSALLKFGLFFVVELHEFFIQFGF